MVESCGFLYTIGLVASVILKIVSGFPGAKYGPPYYIGLEFFKNMLNVRGRMIALIPIHHLFTLKWIHLTKDGAFSVVTTIIEAMVDLLTQRILLILKLGEC